MGTVSYLEDYRGKAAPTFEPNEHERKTMDLLTTLERQVEGFVHPIPGELAEGPPLSDRLVEMFGELGMQPGQKYRVEVRRVVPLGDEGHP